MKKTLQTLGALGLLAWTAAGLWGWSQVSDRVRIVVQADDSEESQAAVLLADRVDALSNDLDALLTALEANFGSLAQALESREVRQAAEGARAGERLAQLEAALPAALQARETAGALSAVLARLEGLARQPARVEALPEPEAVAATEPALLPTAPLDGPPPGAALEAPAGRSFLAFRLPSRDFQFEGQQTFEVLGDLSRVGFDAKSTLHDFSGVSNRVSGRFRVDLARPEAGLEGSITIEAGSLTTALDGRDEAMREHLNTAQHARIEFVPTSFETTRSDAQTRELEGRVHGRMTIRGVAREVALDLRAHVDESRRLVLEGELPLLLSDYDVPVPNQLGVISMEDEVRVWIHLRARAGAGGAAQ
jgi:polyisoprenoid-binding protein YceI